jgi:hypothetical protein
MTPRQARQLVLLRAHECSDPPLPAWGPTDQAWASEEAWRQLGEQADSEAWLLRRAELGCGRLLQRDPGLAATLQPGGLSGWTMAGLVMLAALAGLASDVVGPAQRINLLAPPLLVVIGWNLLVYLGLIAGMLAAARGGSLAAGAWVHTLGPIRRALVGLGQRLRLARRTGPAARRFAEDWAKASAPQQAARLAATLHLAAAAVAAGALAALYLRGLGNEFRAGWDSTFLGAEAVRAWLGVLLGPAAALTGITLPDVQQLEALRFSQGPGENAARWIHLHALTTAGLVLLPRLAMAAWSAWRARQLARKTPLAADDPWRRRLLQQHAHTRRGAALRVQVLPYSLGLAPAQLPALAEALAEALGPELALDPLPGLPLGGEDELAVHWPVPDPASSGPTSPGALVLLFKLAATPERETHGACLRAVLARCAASHPPLRCLVVIDESTFRQRLDRADLATRLAQRRAAWQSLLAESSQVPVFADLGRAPGSSA